MTAPVSSCPACHADDVAVMPEVHIEMFWSRRSDRDASNGVVSAELHLCPRCGHVSLFARDPAATIADFGPLLTLRKAASTPYR